MGNEEENKVVLIGQSGVGKTYIINQFIKGKFEEIVLSKSNPKICRKKIEIHWDTRKKAYHFEYMGYRRERKK